MPASPLHDRFLALVDEHRRPLAKVCWAYGRTPHDRDDLFQDIVTRLWSSFGSYDGHRPFLTWMYRVALNVAIDHRRRGQRWGRDGASFDETMIPSADSERPDQLHILRELLDQQNDADRALLLLYLEGHSYREIGDVLGMSESNIGTRLYRLKESMRQSAQRSQQTEGRSP